MRHKVVGRKLARPQSSRKRLLQGLAVSLFKHESIITTREKAKELRPFAEKLLTLAKVKTLHKIRRAISILQDKEIVKKLFDDIALRIKDRNGGYTRILLLGGTRLDKNQDSKWAQNRLGDNGKRAIIELVDKKEKEDKKPAKAKKEEKKAKK
jgi:large subunit ribosomal protein L17